MRLNAEIINAYTPQGNWHIDTYSTILSRRHSLHAMHGKLRLVKIKRAKQPCLSNAFVVIRKPLFSGLALAVTGYVVAALAFCL